MQVKRFIQGIAGVIERADITTAIISFLLGIIIGVFVGVSISNEPEQAPIVENYVENVENLSIEVSEIKTTQKATDVTTKKSPEFMEFEATATAYCSCKKCCGKNDGITATGTKATEGRTIAVDPRVIPYGTEVIIDGHTYIAEDCGGAVKGKAIDIYFDSHEEALNFGRRSVDVKIKV